MLERLGKKNALAKKPTHCFIEMKILLCYKHVCRRNKIEYSSFFS